jgi:hypothetical protein
MTDILCLDPNGSYLSISSYFCFKINRLEITDRTHDILSEHGDLLCGLHLTGAYNEYSLKDIVLFLSKLEDDYGIELKFVNLRIDTDVVIIGDIEPIRINASTVADLLDFYRDFNINFNIICNRRVNPIKALIDYVLFHESYGRLNIGLCLDLERLNPTLWLNKEIQDAMSNYIQSVYYNDRLQIK